MTLPANIRVNVRIPFPAQVKPAAFVTVSKTNGVWTVGPDYRVLAPAPATTPTQIVALQDSVTGLWSKIGAAVMVAGALNAYRIITAAGTVVVLATDVVLLLQKSPSGPSTINLPAAGSRGGAPVIVKDMTGDANANNITIVPMSGETIDGLSASAALANGIALIDMNYASKSYYPISGGWYAL